MKGFVETPQAVVDLMVETLFHDRPPGPKSQILDPGSGTGAFVDGIVRWCSANGTRVPRIVALEANPAHVKTLRAKLGSLNSVVVKAGDFLTDGSSRFDYIIGNPPYVPITSLDEAEKIRYRGLFSTATGRFDLYLLFFEQAIRSLRERGRLVFITPEKFMYVAAARPLRRILATVRVEHVRLLSEDCFGELVTYPTVTSLVKEPASGMVSVVLRDGRTVKMAPPSTGSSWLPHLYGSNPHHSGARLADACVRISCGVATGADGVFLQRAKEIDADLERFAYPTIAGRELRPGNRDVQTSWYLLTPYDRRGALLPEHELGPFRDFLCRSDRRKRLEARTCTPRKPWYAFHETPPLADLLRPKILCKDIAAEPDFWLDDAGSIVPRHSVYYIVPKDAARMDSIVGYLRSAKARKWLIAHCQRAANGFMRMQSSVLKEMPIPSELVPEREQTLIENLDEATAKTG